MAVSTRTRMLFRFDGELDDVPTDAAAALVAMARALLQHSDEHEGEPATMSLARLGHLLNLWLTDPECSPACLRGSAHLPREADRAAVPAGDARLVLAPGPGEGLRLHWALLLAETPDPGTPVAPQGRRPHRAGPEDRRPQDRGLRPPSRSGAMVGHESIESGPFADTWHAPSSSWRPRVPKAW